MAIQIEVQRSDLNQTWVCYLNGVGDLYLEITRSSWCLKPLYEMRFPRSWVPSLFGPRDQFHGRLIFHGPRVGCWLSSFVFLKHLVLYFKYKWRNGSVWRWEQTIRTPPVINSFCGGQLKAYLREKVGILSIWMKDTYSFSLFLQHREHCEKNTHCKNESTWRPPASVLDRLALNIISASLEFQQSTRVMSLLVRSCHSFPCGSAGSPVQNPPLALHLHRKKWQVLTQSDNTLPHQCIPIPFHVIIGMVRNLSLIFGYHTCPNDWAP